MKIRGLVLSVCALIAGHTVAMEKDSESWSSVIDGAADPTAVPYSIKLEAFLGLWMPAYRSELLPLLSPADSALMDGMAQAEMTHQAQDANAYLVGLAELCGHGSAIDAVELARHETALANAVHESRTARYLSGLEQLSSAGRTAVEHFIAEKVTPNVRFTQSDSVALARESEEEFRHAFDILCDASLNGPAQKAVLDALARKGGKVDVLSIELSRDESE